MHIFTVSTELRSCGHTHTNSPFLLITDIHKRPKTPAVFLFHLLSPQSNPNESQSHEELCGLLTSKCIQGNCRGHIEQTMGSTTNGNRCSLQRGILKSVIQYERLLDETFKKKNLDSFILSQKETH